MKVREKFKRSLSFLLAVLMMLSPVFSSVLPVSALEQESITIHKTSWEQGDNIATDWAARNEWLANAIMKLQTEDNAYMLTFASNNNKINGTLNGLPNRQKSLSFVKEIFQDASGNWIQCFDYYTPAEGARFVGQDLPAGYNVMSKSEATEIANVIGNLFPGGRDASVLLANVDKFVKPAYRDEARAMFGGQDGEIGAAILMQALAWIRAHNFNMCYDKANEYEWSTTGFTDPKTGSYFPPSYGSITGHHICDVIDFEALYNVGLQKSSESAECFDVVLDYNKRTAFTGAVAESLEILNNENKIPAGINYEKVGNTVYLTSTLTVGRDFGELHAGGLSNSFSSSVPYDNRGSGQLIVKSYKVKNVCVRVRANDGWGYIGIKSKIDKESKKPISGVKFGVYADSQARGTKLAEIVTKADGSAVNAGVDAIIVGRTYYVRELTHAEGQPTWVVPSSTVYPVNVTSADASKPTYVVANSSTSIENVMEQFRFQFDKKDITGKGTDFTNVGYKLRVVSLVKDLNRPKFPVGGFVKESDTSANDLILKVVNGKIQSTNYNLGGSLQSGRYELIEYSIPEGTNALPAPTGSKIVFENLGDVDKNGTTDNNLTIISNNTSANALKQQNDLLTALGGRPVSNPNFGNNVWGEAIPFGLIRIIKTDKVSRQPLANFEFKVSSKSGEATIWDGTNWVAEKVYKTGTDGAVVTDPMLLGDYDVEEVKTTGNYLLADPKVQTVTVGAAQAKVNANVVNFGNEQQLFDFFVQKKFATVESGKAVLEGAKFEVKVQSLEVEGIIGQKQPGEVVGTYTTDSNGSFSVTNLPLGVYIVKEIEAPVGTVLNSSEVTVRGAYDGTQNKKSSDVTYDFANNTNSTGAVTDELFKKLNIVWNSYLEQDKIGTIDYTASQLGITPNDKSADNVFFNHVIKGRVEVNKHMDTDEEINSGVKPAESGITFKVIDKATGTEVDSFTTNKMGRGGSKYLPFGEYTLSQFNTVVDEKGNSVVTKVKSIDFAINEDGQVIHYTLENAPLRMRLQISKVDEVTKKNILQEGVQFQIFKAENDELVKFTQYFPEPVELDRITISAKTGEALTLDKLKSGEYYLKEVAGPEGYVYDPEVKIPFSIPYEETPAGTIPVIDITIGAKTETVVDKDVQNTPQYGELVINKEGEKLTGWVNKDVTVKIQNQGTVETKEVKTPQANVSLVIKQVITKEVEVDVTETDGKETEVPVENKDTEVKKEKVTKEVEEVRNVVTNTTGAYTEEVGEGKYTVYGPDNAVLQELTVKKGGKGTINVQLPDNVKTEEVRIDGTVEDKTYTYKTPVFEKGYLGGAKFEVIAKEDLNSYDKQTKFFSKGDKLPIAQQDIAVDGKVVYKKDEVITFPALSAEIMANKTLVDYTITTTNNEGVKLSRIPLGSIDLREVEAPEGYKLDSTVRSYTFTPQERTILVDLKETEKIENFRQILTLQLNKKVVEETQYFGRGGYDYIVFGIYNAEEIGGLAKDSLVGVVQPDSNGVLTFNDVLKGNYYFKEISTKDAYVLNENQYAISASYDHNPTEDKTEVVKTEVPNTPVEKKVIKITKVDVKTGTALEGVGFKLYAVTKDGVKVPVMNGESDLWVTDKEGTIVVDSVPQGNYVWEEAKPLPGYVKEDLTYHVAVSDDSNLEITAGNTPTDIGFRKYDIQTGKPVVGATLRLEVKNANGEWVPVFIDNKGYVVEEGGKALEWLSDGELKNVYGLSLDKEYRLVEVNAPKGYATAEPVEFRVDNVKGVQLTSLGNQMIRAKIKKVDESSLEPVYGATLELYEEGSDTIFVDPVTGKEAKWVTSEENKDGYVVNGLVSGKAYVVKETTVPEGYNEPYYRYTLLVADRAEVQTFTFMNEPKPEIKTTAMFETGVKENSVSENIKVVDEVVMKKLVVGKTYTAKGTLVDQANPENVIARGETTFVAESTEQKVQVEFTVNAKELAGTTTVVFEDLYRDGRLVASHAEVQDEDQTVYFPNVKTTATDKVDGGKDALASENVTIVDKVEYTNLKVGQEYTVKGTLRDKSTGEEFKVNGNVVTAEKKFVAEESNGFVELEFTFDGSALKGKSVVVFEDLYNGDVKVATHSDINDEGQTVDFPEVKTTASDKTDGGKEAFAGKEVTIVDEVKYFNLIVSKEYEVKGTLMDKETNKPLIIDGKEVKASTKFVAESKDGVVNLEFTFNAEGLEGKSVVVFEDLYREGKLVGVHADINDEGQTVHIPKVRTNASDKETGLQVIQPKGTKTIIDKVTYTNLVVGKEYEAKGTLMDKETGKAVVVDGKEVVATKKFVAESVNGVVELEFVVKAEALEGKTTVVFEDLFKDGKLIATHSDINDEAQTIYFPSAKTQVSSHTVKPNKEVKLVDTVTYTNLQVGKEYVVTGKLMDKATGQPILINGKEVVATKTFVAESENGTVDIEFVFDASQIAGKDVVVFEEVTLDGVLVAEHKDINSKEQTFHVEEAPKKPKTGQDEINKFVYLGGGLGAFAVAGLAIFLTSKKRRKDNE